MSVAQPADLERIYMGRTWKPTTAGILCIIAGVIGVIPGIVVVASTDMFGAPSIVPGIIAIIGGIYSLKRRGWGLALAGSICALFGPAGFLVIVGLLAVKYADMVPGLQPPPIIDTFFSSSYFDFSAGSVILGILAIIFVIMGKREFK
ncbi:MAG: hypothetical protein ABSF21_03570 [Dehalococcoidia bacterium]|jgi:uncharacterized membrane protein HdeD (DUF308 family)